MLAQSLRPTLVQAVPSAHNSASPPHLSPTGAPDRTTVQAARAAGCRPGQGIGPGLPTPVPAGLNLALIAILIPTATWPPAPTQSAGQVRTKYGSNSLLTNFE